MKFCFMEILVGFKWLDLDLIIIKKLIPPLFYKINYLNNNTHTDLFLTWPLIFFKSSPNLFTAFRNNSISSSPHLPLLLKWFRSIKSTIYNWNRWEKGLKILTLRIGNNYSKLHTEDQWARSVGIFLCNFKKYNSYTYKLHL